MFGIVLLAIILRVSLSFAVGSTAVIFDYLMLGPNGMYSIVSTMFGGIWSILMSSISFFAFIGVVLAKSNIPEDLYHAFYLWSGRMPGGLLLDTSSFAATLSEMTGSYAASTITTGTVGIPAMDRRGYDHNFVLGTIGASGTFLRVGRAFPWPDAHRWGTDLPVSRDHRSFHQHWLIPTHVFSGGKHD
ncbi:TRAP transporter large permease subunit [Ruegeria sp. 2205SS24-7]|uniref:TRAP transporter large permease subunit n=1 Tax=Ruegeria discodermiae TaxID=3064389 RepID=UPI0027404775|nr:TRAP transporter large permease subunit [Ruegeria sp. 2205SS24-7]MDP5217291.1 TRAP transporter large permease subunit [Ruegeria sp. 2205SS24-7]